MNGTVSAAAFYTSSIVPNIPTVSAVSAVSLSTAITAGDGNPATTQYSIQETGSGNYIQADGTLGATEVFNTSTGWGTKTVTGLSSSTLYTFKVRAENGDSVTTTQSGATSKYTLATQASAPTISASTTIALNLVINANGNNTATTTYAVYNSTSGNYIAADGTASSSAVYQTKALWDLVDIVGLNTSTAYQFTATARNGDSVLAATSSANTAVYTLATAASAPTISASSSVALNLIINANGNSSAATYAVYNFTSSNYLAADGTANGSTAVYQTKALWDAVDAVGLATSTAYQFKAIARNATGGTDAATSSANTAVYTLASQASAPTISASSTTALNLTINANGNSSAATYAVYNSTSGNYLAADGTANGSTAVYQTKALWDVVDITGLSVNTGYQFTATARNATDITDAATSSANTAVYTLTTAPTSFMAVVNNSSQITLSWAGAGTNYYVENTTAGTNSGWLTGTSHPFSGLTCATSYTFRVKANNVSSVDTDWASSVTATTQGCGGSDGSSVAPSVASPATAAIITTNGTAITQNITLNFSATNATQMAVSEDPGFVGASWMPYSASSPFTLSSGVGAKTLYVKFRSASGGVTDVYTIKTNLVAGYTPAVTPVISPIVTAPVVSTPAATSPVSPISSVVTAPTFEVSSPDSAVIIPTVSKLVYKPGEAVKFKYTYKNDSDVTQKIKVTRQLVNVNGKILSTSKGSATLKKGKAFSSTPSQALSSKLVNGVYTVVVKILDSKNNVLEANSFEIIVQKPLPPPAITTNNPESVVVITGLKVDYKPGSAVKYSYSYKNESTKPSSIKIVRQVVDSNGKVVSQVTGTRILAKGQKMSFNATSALSKKLSNGTYTIVVKVLDTKGVVLAENSFDLTVKK